MKKIYLFIIIACFSQTLLIAQPYKSQISLREKNIFMITDIGFTVPINSGKLKRSTIINSELGMMANLNSEFALGGTIHFAFGNYDTNYYVKLRARKWLSDEMSIDFAPGYDLINKRFIASLDFHYNKWFALTTQIEPVNTYNGFTYPVSAGLKLSSRPGLVTNIIAILGTLVALASYDWDCFMGC